MRPFIDGWRDYKSEDLTGTNPGCGVCGKDRSSKRELKRQRRCDDQKAIREQSE